MKRSNLLNQRLAASYKLLRNLRTSLSFDVCPFFKGLSHLYHNFDLSSLSDNVRKDEFAYMQQFISCNLPSPNRKTAILRELIVSVRNAFSSEVVNEPINHVFVSITNTKICGELRSSNRRHRITSNGNASFAVNDSSQVGKNSWLVGLSNIFFSAECGHKTPFGKVFYDTVRKMSINLQPERLSPEDFFSKEERYAIV